jgi:hypothetical protein
MTSDCSQSLKFGRPSPEEEGYGTGNTGNWDPRQRHSRPDDDEGKGTPTGRRMDRLRPWRVREPCSLMAPMLGSSAPRIDARVLALKQGTEHVETRGVSRARRPVLPWAVDNAVTTTASALDDSFTPPAKASDANGLLERALAWDAEDDRGMPDSPSWPPSRGLLSATVLSALARPPGSLGGFDVP